MPGESRGEGLRARVRLSDDAARSSKWIWTMLAPVHLYLVPTLDKLRPNLAWRLFSRYWRQRYNRVTFVYRAGNEFKIDIAGSSAVGEQVAAKGTYERGELAYLVREALDNAGLVVDVGANIGIYAGTVLACSPESSVIAVEPLQTNFRELESNLSPFRSRAQLFNTALGSEAGQYAFTLRGDGALAGLSTTEHSDGVWPVVTLDSIWESLGRPAVSIMKIDVEGGEVPVLEGARELLAAAAPKIMVEANTQQARDALDVELGSLGYVRTRPSKFESYNYVYLRTR